MSVGQPSVNVAFNWQIELMQKRKKSIFLLLFMFCSEYLLLLEIRNAHTFDRCAWLTNCLWKCRKLSLFDRQLLWNGDGPGSDSIVCNVTKVSGKEIELSRLSSSFSILCSGFLLWMCQCNGDKQTNKQNINTFGKKNVVDETKAKRSAENSQGNVYIKSGKINQM